MKKIFYILTFLLFTVFSAIAQDAAICGWDGSGSSSSGDEVSFVLLRDFTAGEIIYITEDEYSDAANNFVTPPNEGHIAFTIPAGGLLENRVINIIESSSGVYIDQCGSGGTAVQVPGTGGWSLVADGLGGCTDEIYIYSASNPASPWSSVTEVHSFAWASNVTIPTDQNPAPDHPNVILIDFNIGGLQGVNADFKDASKMNTTEFILLDGTNWTKTANPITLSCVEFANLMILPVELINFSVKEKEDHVILNWSTAREINNDYFQIEHSVDGRDFKKVKQVEGMGNSDIINHYHFTDKNPSNGVNYYRLKQVDYDGRFEYSKVVSVNFKTEKDEVSISPNPFAETISIKIPFLAQNYTSNNERIIRIFDIHNRLVRSQLIPNDEDTIQLNLSELSDGIYFISTHLGKDDFYTHRILKQRD